MGLLRKWPGPKHRVRLNQVSALEGVRFNQVSLYIQVPQYEKMGIIKPIELILKFIITTIKNKNKKTNDLENQHLPISSLRNIYIANPSNVFPTKNTIAVIRNPGFNRFFK